jgi:hypothetical protein
VRTTPAEAPRCGQALGVCQASGALVSPRAARGVCLKTMRGAAARRIPAGGCKDRANAAHGRKTRRPEVIPGGIIVSNLKHALAYAEKYDRILYGMALAPMERYRRFIERIGRAGIPANRRAIVWRNALRLEYRP